jgi:hypothetical protein
MEEQGGRREISLFQAPPESKRKRGLRAKKEEGREKVNQFSQAPSACTHLKGCTSFAGCTGLDGSQCASCQLGYYLVNNDPPMGDECKRM